MYKGFYGLNESPFSIAPNPAFLFLSDRHREALAHLTYGLGENGGFVLLTGEVGTGKTTVSRTLFAQLPDDTDLAFILNPALTQLELLATVCDQLKLSYQPEPTLKQLTDKIADFLLENHKNGRKTLLVIDEAQHLDADVLEQLRLLTNLETDTRKLLQVILIGQPELQALLRRQELRQLAQRITARYHLLPLNLDEVAAYVSHRLHVAGRSQPLFRRSAIKALHQVSGGVPRIINLICERALMGGYGQQKAQLAGVDIDAAAAEVLDRPQAKRVPWGLGVATIAAAGLGFALAYGWQPSMSQPSSTAAVVPVAEVTPPITVAAPKPSVDLASFPSSELSSLQALFHRWQQPVPATEPCRYAADFGLSCLSDNGSWQQLLQLNRPAMVTISDDSGQIRYGAVLSKEPERWLLQLGDQQLWVQHDWFALHYQGRFTLLWQPTEALPRLISPSASLAQIQWLENRLAQVQQRSARLVASFDSQLERALRQFQLTQGLNADGLAGRQTLERLSLLLANVGPTLVQENR
ncbi:ExeA family protein [Ferrimonas lipolytica]|uniref:AAA family ATPase n=1 Tax=Ferrimonas lipolytica TaxID=2724191 RepID=A0A6H1UIX6_9GAMM|nr:ExeA family protein [Ferrimonas lipolytica]QIZ77752.1 AAA family ATPase [Ferrimonas lipolytica]